MFLENLPKRNKRITKAKRLGRGYGSGVGGHTATRGSKGQKSRSGHKSLVMFEGGNRPFYSRIPKFRGFKPADKSLYEVVNVSTLSDFYADGDIVNIESLKEKGIVKKGTKSVKVLAHGEIDKKLTIEGLQFSESAKVKIEKAKGSLK